MFSKKQLVIISFVLAILFNFTFYFNLYGPPIGILQSYIIYVLALGSVFLIFFLFIGTYWRADLRGRLIRWVFDLLVAWIFVCFLRSLLEIRTRDELIQFVFSNYMGLALFPVLFFIVGVNINYFFSVNRILSIYFFLATFISLFFINYVELQHFLLLPIFYMILTIPLRSFRGRLTILLISIIVVIFSFTNRAEILRISMSYLIIAAFYVLSHARVSKKLLYPIVFIILMIPVVSLYLGFKGQSVFQVLSGEDARQYSQLDPYADTRTFLYYEVFQDLKMNDAFLLGKGMNAGYYSESFESFSRPVVEVGFLQMLLKTGLVGFFLYIIVIISSIVRALGRSNNSFVKSLGVLLASYILMLFIENVIAYNLLNVIIWIIVGMCNSESLRTMSDRDVTNLFNNKKMTVNNQQKLRI